MIVLDTIKKFRREFTVAIAVILFIVVAQQCVSNRNKAKENENLIEALNDTIVIWRDKDSLSNSKIQTLKTEKVKDFLKIKSKDKQITDLQDVVKKYQSELKNGGSVTNFTSVTNVNSKGKTQVIPKDSVKVGDVIEMYPTYKYDFVKTGDYLKEKDFVWVTGHVESNRDDTEVSTQIINKYSVILGEESQGWFKPRKPFALVKNYNPFSETTELRTYEVSRPAYKPFGISGFVGYGVGIDFQPQPFIGVGITYTPEFLRF
jgi:hypothetical protein